MSTVIWKFPLRQIAVQELLMPVGARVLTVQHQAKGMTGSDTYGWHLNAQLWAEVNPDGEGERRTIAMVGTGSPMPGPRDRWVYVATVQHDGFVWHYYIDRDRERARLQELQEARDRLRRGPTVWTPMVGHTYCFHCLKKEAEHGEGGRCP